MAKADPSWPTEWRAYLDARNGPHQIEAIALHSSGVIATNKTIWFTNQASDRADLSYFSEGQLTQRVNSAGTSQRLAWDGKGRLIRANERDVNGNGYDWSAVYDPFGRRWKTSTFTVTNNIAVGSQPHVITSFFDPLHEFLETRVEVNGRTFYKIHGPDQNSVYGGWNGSGGVDAISYSSGVVLAYITDTTGNILGTWNPSSLQTKWNSSRPSGYGGTPGYRPPALTYDIDLAEAVSWRGKWMDITGLYWIGARYYEPVSGRFVSCDPYGHDAGPSLYAFAEGDPINYFDPDGRLATSAINAVNNFYTSPEYLNHSGQAEIDRLNYRNYVQNLPANERAVHGLPIPLLENSVHAYNAIASGDPRALSEAGERFRMEGYAAGLGALLGRYGNINPRQTHPPLGDLTATEIRAIQGAVDRTSETVTVVGSAARGTRRGVGTDLPIGKGSGTRSDIDYVVEKPYPPFPAALDDLDDLTLRLPDINPAHGPIRGTFNPYEGPGIRFSPGTSPTILPGT